MNKFITLLLSLFIHLISYGQSFEGKITYSNEYKSKMPNIPDQQFASMMGTSQDYYIKGGNYKSFMNGTFAQWQLYVNNENMMYCKYSISGMLYWNNAGLPSDTIINVTINKNVTEILGYKCDEIILTTKKGFEKYYYSSKLAVDPKLFVRHKYGNWYDFVSKSKALPLKIIEESTQFSMISVATEVKAMPLEDIFFELPKDAKTAKSPY